MKMLAATAIALSAACAAAAVTPAATAAEPAAPPATQPATGSANDRATQEKAFADLLTNSVMAGSFTAGRNGPPRMDRYTILKAAKAAGDDWVITAKIEYKGIGIPVDITVPVKWAGDTPVISVTNQKIPGFGTFTARVMFYAGQYAGTWDAGDHGGLMWGRVEKAAAPATPATRPAN
jgi:hypothetical protein